MLKIGLTGGIGSGKSTASRIFSTLGIPVYDSDSRAKMLMANDPRIKQQLVCEFGARIYKCGKLDTSYLASRVFTDKPSLQKLNSIVHPALLRDFFGWAESFVGQDVPYVVMEAAILFEAGFGSEMDYTVTVSAPLEERVTRAAERDGIFPDAIRDRVANQMTDQERESRADFVLHNAEEDMLLQQVLETNEKLVKLVK